MKTSLRFLLAFVFCSTAFAQQYDFSRLDKLLQDSLPTLGGTANEDFGGLTLLVWKNGKLIYDKSLALPGKTMTKTRMMPIASASKWMS